MPEPDGELPEPAALDVSDVSVADDARALLEESGELSSADIASLAELPDEAVVAVADLPEDAAEAVGRAATSIQAAFRGKQFREQNDVGGCGSVAVQEGAS